MSENGDIERSAVISPCGTYRYRLDRKFTTMEGLYPQRQIVFFMLNPSTADGIEDDPTIRRCMGFAQAWGYSHLTVLNLFAYRATDPKNLPWLTHVAVGPEWEKHTNEVLKNSSRVICGWGANVANQSGWMTWQEKVIATIKAHLQPEALGITKQGYPRHPLYMKADSEPKSLDALLQALESE